MKYSRKEFLKLSGGLTAGIALSDFNNIFLKTEAAGRIKTFGLQLYTLRDDMLKDPKSILKKVAAFGYKQIESYEGPKGMFWGMSNKQFKTYMDELDMSIIASHCDINKDFEKKVDEAAEIGMKYLIYNWPYAQQTIEEYKRNAALFNKCGETCRSAGIRFAYHNYESSFQLVDGIYPHDLLMKETDPKLVDQQMDFYWVVSAGQDPVYWLKKYPNRFRLCHIKDRIKGSNEKDASCILGEGSIDFPEILKAAKKNGMNYFIVEQERYDNATPLKAAEAGSKYMNNLRI